MSALDETRRALQHRIGDRNGGRIIAMLEGERRAIEAGVRDLDEPSPALTDAYRALMGSEFTADERARIRLANGIDVLADAGLSPKPTGSES